MVRFQRVDLVEAQKFEKRIRAQVVIRRLLGEQIVDVGIFGSGKN